MKKIAVFLLMFISSLAIASPTGKTPQEAYIEKYSPLAVAEMYRSGVPASITLAQGMLESGNGQSELARMSNNHFGIKCHNNWSGGRVYYDDDAKGECFRKYDHPSESYHDHSDFLRYRDRYKFLFDYKVTDYKSWAYGLKKAGYATDPAYPKKLIKLIEEYDLHQYDRKPASYGKANHDKHKYKGKSNNQEKKTESKPEKKEKTIIKFAGESLPEEDVADQLPLSPTIVEQVKKLSEKQREVFQFSLSRQIYTQNGVPFVYSVQGESYASIAASHNLFLREILKFNDLVNEQELLPGTVVYLRAKKKTAAKGVDKYVMEEGETIRQVSQRFGVRLASLLRMNDFEEGYIPREGDIIRMRK
jgi:flagellum-specific peptidoglycan hydrolase FlgJ